MLSVLAGPDDRDRHSLPAADFDWRTCFEGGIRGLKVAYSADWGYAAVEPAVREIVGAAVKVFESDLGCTVEEASPGWDDPFDAFAALMVSETDLKGMRAMIEQHGHRMSPHLVELMRHAWTAEDLTDAVIARKGVVNKMWRFMRTYDLLLTPTLACPPFPVHMQGPERIDGRIVAPARWICFTFRST